MDSYGLERYTRHILLKEIGGPGQLNLSNSRITMIGAGGLGSFALYYLVASGVGNIKIVDILGGPSRDKIPIYNTRAASG